MLSTTLMNQLWALVIGIGEKDKHMSNFSDPCSKKSPGSIQMPVRRGEKSSARSWVVQESCRGYEVHCIAFQWGINTAPLTFLLDPSPGHRQLLNVQFSYCNTFTVMVPAPRPAGSALQTGGTAHFASKGITRL